MLMLRDIIILSNARKLCNVKHDLLREYTYITPNLSIKERNNQIVLQEKLKRRNAGEDHLKIFGGE